MMLCKARKLNPWEGDAYLTGYDMADGPQFNLITAVQALYKRAEMCDEFDGIESGVCVMRGDVVTERTGALVLPGETLIGGWARCHRKDRKFPFYQSVQLSVYDTKYSRWKKDPSGMIQKVARSAVLREAFPNHLSGMYIREEMDTVEGEVVKNRTVETTSEQPTMIRGPQDLTAALKSRNGNGKASTTQTTQTTQSNAKSNESDSVKLRNQLLEELKSADTETAIASIEEDVNTSTVLTEADRNFLLDAIGASQAE
jgi:phage recombination protein Bet